jgi:chemosensory pili system protein ChpA (sensor histidine kinase/response regulator)
MAKTIDRELLSGFTGEVKSNLPRIRRSFAMLAADPTRVDRLEEAHRLVHSIKGAASMLGLSALGHIAFLEEETIEQVASAQVEWTASVLEGLEHVLSLIENYLDALNADTLHERPILTDAVKTLRRLQGQPESGDEAEIELLLGSEGDPVLAPPSEESLTPAAPSPVKRAARPQAVSAADLQREYANVPPDLLETFREEAEDILHNVGDLLRPLESGGTNGQALLDIRRHAHTLKGAAGSVGLHALSSLAHRLEDLLGAINEGITSFSPDIHNLLLATFDCIGDMAEAQNLADLGPRMGNLYARYTVLLDEQADVASPAAPMPGAEAASLPAEPPIPNELVEAFRAEAEDHLLKVGEGLRALEKGPEDKSVIQEIRRTIHTLKGASNMVGMRSMSTLAHGAEDLLDAIYQGAVPLSQENLALLFNVADTLGDLASGGNQPEVLARRNELMDILSGVPSVPATPTALEPLGAERAIDVPQPAEQAGSAPEARRPSQYVRVPIERLDELVRLVSELLVNRSTFEQYLANYSQEIDELSHSTGRLKRISSQLDSGFEVTPLRGGIGQLGVRAVVADRSKEESRKDFDSLEFDRYTDFHLISRDLTETSSDIGSATGELSQRIADFDSHLNRLGRLTSEMQDKLMRMRMVPLSSLSTRLRRTVRVTSDRRQKPVDLIMEGEQVELDKTVLEEIAAPLEHLLRNAVDHGIESESTRQVLGKPSRGQIRLRAYHEGTQVVIQVSDDGGGMEPDLLRQAAVRGGFYSEADVAQLPLASLYNLIFLPGFSTARTLSETSGRGVGMDIVKSTVNKMKGITSIETEPGRGTTFSIRLPMTLAIMRVLLVESNGETLAMPLSVVTQILRVEPEQIERIGHQMVLRLDERVIPAVHLGEALRLPRPADASIRRLPVLIVSLGERQLAFIAERLIEAREVVVKTMGTLLRRVEGVIGATLMGDGSVVLIVNPSDLAPAGAEEAGRQMRAPAIPQVSGPSRVYDVLIVDDSVSVRKVLSNLIRGRGWNPLTARDGVEALEIIERSVKPPDVVLLDIEMPRMDGYELLTLLRANDAHKRLPVIMLTSRSGEKHRRKAFDLGATDYLVKPYEEDTLLTVIRNVVSEARAAAVQ